MFELSIAACPDQNMGSTQGFHGFAKRSFGKEPTVPDGMSRVDQDDIKVPVERPVLEGIVQDQDVCAEMPDGGPSREAPPGAGQNRDSRQGAGDQDRFISRLTPGHEESVPIRDDIDGGFRAATVAAAQDRRSASLFSEKLGEEDHHRRLPGASNDEVSHADHRTGEFLLPEEPPII